VDVDIERIVLVLAALVPSIILHEVSHGVVALAFGDDTARRAGRLTLNPFRHIDPFGSVLLPVLMALSSIGAFGYAKPVPVDLGRLRRPREHALWVALAGPATNIVLAVLAAVALRTLRPETGTVADFIVLVGVINVVLAAFNLLPVPPLDGSAIIERFLPRAWLGRWLQLRRYSMVLVLVVVLALPQVLNVVFRRAIDLWAHLL